MATISPNTFTFTTVLAPVSQATSTTPLTTYVLDLRQKWGAFIIPVIGKTNATALTRSAYFAIRPTFNGNNILPVTAYDFYSQLSNNTATTTVASGGAAGAATVTLTSGTGFAVGNVICLSSGSSRIEFANVADVTGAVVTIDRSTGFITSHNATDNVTNGVDIGRIWIPGGDQYEITPMNNSGQTVILACYAEIYASDNAA